MSDQIPFEIQIEIIKRLPVKSLIRFRSVSKPWKSLIDCSDFIADYNLRYSHPKQLLVSYRDLADSELICVSVDDDDTFPQRKCSVVVPNFFKLIKDLQILSSSHGLLCLYGYYEDKVDFSSDLGYGVVVLWNPAIRKSVVIKVPDELDYTYKTVVGFGVCPRTNDPKLVKINCIWDAGDWESISCRQVEVFTLSSGVWRTSYGDLPHKWIILEDSHIVIDGFIYWVASDHMIEDENQVYNQILSFDLASEQFREICLPDYLTLPVTDFLLISKLRDSLVVVKGTDIDEKRVYGIWIMEHGVPNTFTKLFTIDVPDTSLDGILGFRENCEPILDALSMYNSSATLKVYEPSTKLMKDLGIYGKLGSFSVSSYMEMLMLLDQPDCCKHVIDEFWSREASYRDQTAINERGELPSLIDLFRTMHVFTHPDLEEQYHRMVDMRTQQAGSPNPITEKEIMLDVLGPRRGHVRGVGIVVAGASTSTSASNARSSPTKRYYSQTEVDNMTAQVEARIEERMRSVVAEAVRETLRGLGHPFNLLSPDFRHTDDDEHGH